MYLSEKTVFTILSGFPPPTHDGALLAVSKMIDAVISPAHESKNGVGIINGK